MFNTEYTFVCLSCNTGFKKPVGVCPYCKKNLTPDASAQKAIERLKQQELLYGKNNRIFITDEARRKEKKIKKIIIAIAGILILSGIAFLVYMELFYYACIL